MSKQSPGYPSFPLLKAISFVKDIFEKDRRNPIDRETAAKHIGYSGISGASDKALATLGHYGLLEKAGTGQTRVTQVAVDILYPDSEEDKKSALLSAGLNPTIFKEINDRFSDGTPSDTALKAWLMRENFLDRAINPVTKAYLETSHYLDQEGVSQNYNPSQISSIEPNPEDVNDNMNSNGSSEPVAPAVQTPPPLFTPNDSELNEVKAELLSGGKVRVSGFFDMDGLERLERKIQALKLLIED